MKLKRFISAFLALGIVASATPAFAAESDVFQIGTPYDITLGEFTDELTAGNVIAVPINVETTTDGLTGFQIEIQYDNTVLTPGYDINSASDAFWTNIEGVTGSQGYATDEVTLQTINALGTKRGSSFSGVGTVTYNPAVDDHTIAYTWFHNNTKAVNADGAEGYAVFTVKKSVTALNEAVLSVDTTTCGLSDTVNGKEHTFNVANEVDKANACVAAFQVDIDNDAIATQGVWIQSLYAKVGDAKAPLTVCNNDGVSTTYSFPTRVITNTTGNEAMSIEIYATVSDDEAGTTTTDVLVGTVEVTADSTATDYGTATNVDSVKQ